MVADIGTGFKTRKINTQNRRYIKWPVSRTNRYWYKI